MKTTLHFSISKAVAGNVATLQVEARPALGEEAVFSVAQSFDMTATTAAAALLELHEAVKARVAGAIAWADIPDSMEIQRETLEIIL